LPFPAPDSADVCVLWDEPQEEHDVTAVASDASTNMDFSTFARMAYLAIAALAWEILMIKSPIFSSSDTVSM